MLSDDKYPRIDQLGLKVYSDRPGPPGIHFHEVSDILGPIANSKFLEMMTGQTFGPNGAYPWDVEAVLERMISGKVTGTQRYWD